ncbi:MAG: PD-(D/E)XK nuclease-like domain-containing protein [Candidatus Dormibacteraeota bacterium]|nr:PD-(D/E)XK nuclease-like domain-containing protein [Candidatus Dormibacteraeota bacterium]
MTAATDTRAPGLYDDVPEIAYHADATSLSQSGAKSLLDCPAVYAWERDHPPEPTEAMEFGTALHTLVLGTGPEVITVDAESWRTKTAQETRALTRAAGKIPLLKPQWEQAQAMAAAVWAKPAAAQLLAGGRPEVSAYATHEETGVLRRARFDYLRDDLIIDYKTAFSADPDEWRRNAARYGYHLQHAWYIDIARALDLDIRGLVFVVQQKTPPYPVTCVELVPSAVELGRQRARLALQMFRDCTEAGCWPDYAESIVPVDLPDWVYRDSYREIS